MVPPSHTHFYNNKVALNGYGGNGVHCGFNTENKTHAELPPFGIIADVSGSVKVPLALTDPAGHAGDVLCVMYHTRSRVHHRSLFCDECKTVLGAATLQPKWNWKTD